MGWVYLIESNKTNKVYVGQTSKTIDERFDEHKHSASAYNRWVANPEKYTSYKGSCTYLYKAFNAYGVDTFSIKPLAEVPNDKLDDTEIQYIEQYNSLAPNGYNLTTGGGHFIHCQETKDLISKKVKETMVKNIDKFRTSDKTIGLPPYTAYAKRGGYEAYYVNNHPLCKRKYFSTKKYITLEAAKEAITKFVNDLNAKGDKYIPTNDGVLPKNIRKVGKVFIVRKTVNKVYYEMKFADKAKTLEENKLDAINYLNRITGNN